MSRYNPLGRRNGAPGVPDLPSRSRPPAAHQPHYERLSVSDLLVDLHYPPQREADLNLGYRGHDVLVYHNANGLLRVFTVSSQQTVSSASAALAASTAPGLDRRYVAVAENPFSGLASAVSSTNCTGARMARLVSHGVERVVTQATVPGRALLALTDVYYPGWKVIVDGQPASIDRVDNLLRGLPLTAGSHRIPFSYEPASITACWIVSALGVSAILAAVLVGCAGAVAPRGRGATAPSTTAGV